MRELLREDQFSEVLVLGNQDAIFSVRNRQYLLVRLPARHESDGCGVMTEALKMDRKADAEVLVDEELHAERLSGRGMISSCPASPAA